MSKLTELENFLLNENSTERKNYEDNLLSGKSRRPEEEFITRHLGRDFWKELGYDDSESNTVLSLSTILSIRIWARWLPLNIAFMQQVDMRLICLYYGSRRW